MREPVFCCLLWLRCRVGHRAGGAKTSGDRCFSRGKSTLASDIDLVREQFVHGLSADVVDLVRLELDVLTVVRIGV